MFNVLVSADGAAWETDQIMRMPADRFNEYSTAPDAKGMAEKKPDSLKPLESVPSLLLYENGATGPNADVVRFGRISNIRASGGDIAFNFAEEGRLSRAVVMDRERHLGLGRFELNRTHWAVKDGDIPAEVLGKVAISYDVVFSFAGQERDYVEEVVRFLKSNGVRVFYDADEEEKLWGKNLVEYFDVVYRKSSKYCVMFISKSYVEKIWTRHERRAALARALEERQEYVLPARFDNSEVDGLNPTIAYVSLAGRPPTEFGQLILGKLRKKLVGT